MTEDNLVFTPQPLAPNIGEEQYERASPNTHAVAAVHRRG